jgi:hypothetical protein
MALSGEGARGRDNGDNVNNVPYKTIQNCHMNPPGIMNIYPNKNLFTKKRI